jgi:acetoin utilization protein AcuC
VRLLASSAYLAYDFGDEHPLAPRRLTIGLDLLHEAGLLRAGDEATAPPATDEALQLIHTPAYVEALRRLSLWAPLHDAPLEAEARRYGLGHGDNPVFPDAHQAAAAVAGGSRHAARALLGRPGAQLDGGQRPAAEGVEHVFHPMGGLHHARPDRAAGFCLYNDPAVALAAVVRERDARVLYVDFDVHHGDGVQLCFEDEPRVLTVSFHESGRFLFPGTGDIEEVGRGAGRGFSINVPFPPGTDDASWIEALDTLLPPLAARFRPDLIVSQHGCDTHAFDPLADLRLSTASFVAQAHLVHRLAHEHCAGRWLALGGGGYDIYRVVPRSWALLWAEMAERPLPELVPPAWRDRWQSEARHSLPEHMLDRPEAIPPAPASAAAAAQNRRTLEQVRKLHLASRPEPS